MLLSWPWTNLVLIFLSKIRQFECPDKGRVYREPCFGFQNLFSIHPDYHRDTRIDGFENVRTTITTFKDIHITCQILIVTLFIMHNDKERYFHFLKLGSLMKNWEWGIGNGG